MENERNSSFELNPFKTIKSRMVNLILLNVIETFLTIGFRLPYCRYEVVNPYSSNETREEGARENRSVLTTHHEEGFLNKRPAHVND